MTRRPGFYALPSTEVLFGLFVAITVLAISPAGMYVDRLMDLQWVGRDDESMRQFLLQGPDRLASQRVAGLGLVCLGLWFAWRHKEITPVLVVAAAEVVFVAAGVLKVALAKNATHYGMPWWWDGGFLQHGVFGMAYPSGHATEAVVFYGTMLYLISRYSPVWDDAMARRLTTVWTLVIVNTVIVSWLLGSHWVSDLAGGLAFGLLGLRLVIAWSEHLVQPDVDALQLRDRLARRDHARHE